MFEGHLVKRRDVIFEWATFNQRKQEVGESADALVMDLYSLAEHCDYRDNQEHCDYRDSDQGFNPLLPGV